MQIKDVYKKLPFIHCKGFCHKTCTIVMLSEAEQKIIQEKHGLDFSPAAILERVRNKELTCVALKDKRCSIYEDRPLVCRLYGLDKKMTCNWGCKPKRWLAHKKAVEYIKILDDIDEMV